MQKYQNRLSGLWLRSALTVSLNSFVLATAQGAEPPGYSSIAKWTLNDGTSTTLVNDYANGFDGVVTTNTSTSTVDATRTATDTPPSPEEGVAVDLLGAGPGGVTQSSIIAANTSNGGSLFAETVVTGTSPVTYDFYEGSRTISAWVKLKSSTQGLPLAEGIPSVIFYQGHPPAQSGDRACRLDTGTGVQSANPGAAEVPSNCRAFALGLYRPVGTQKGYVTFGNTNGDPYSQNNAYILDSTTNEDCDIDLLSTGSAGNIDKWHHVVGVFSLDLMDQGLNSAIIYIDGHKCGSGKIVHPYTDVSSAATWRIGTHMDYVTGYSDPQNNYPLRGMIDDVRVYDRALGQPAVTWLYNNTGRASN